MYSRNFFKAITFLIMMMARLIIMMMLLIMLKINDGEIYDEIIIMPTQTSQNIFC